MDTSTFVHMLRGVHIAPLKTVASTLSTHLTERERSMIKAIETHYAGHRFRSRLEARWAVFLTTLGLRWQYEPQGYLVNDRPYLPDFVLPDLKASVEVKGDPAQLDIPLLADAMAPHWKYTLILGDIPPADMKGAPAHTLLATAVDVRPHPQTAQIADDYLNALTSINDPVAQIRIAQMVNARHTTTITMTRAVFVPTKKAAMILPISLSFRSSAEEALKAVPLYPIQPIPRVQAAYTAARSARFEHGESG